MSQHYSTLPVYASDSKLKSSIHALCDRLSIVVPPSTFYVTGTIPVPNVCVLTNKRNIDNTTQSVFMNQTSIETHIQSLECDTTVTCNNVCNIHNAMITEDDDMHHNLP